MGSVKQNTNTIDRELLHTAIVATTIMLTAVLLISGCIYVVSQNNQAYYDTMRQCLESGGSFVPT